MEHGALYGISTKRNDDCTSTCRIKAASYSFSCRLASIGHALTHRHDGFHLDDFPVCANGCRAGSAAAYLLFPRADGVAWFAGVLSSTRRGYRLPAQK